MVNSRAAELTDASVLKEAKRALAFQVLLIGKILDLL
jgi:hypothetical protein